ncbi:MAG TPA: hypothetical protein VNH18_21355, partial [Bryobacteraceae bacterium]|nr:hypothetical protein [Bryobacteraceae bacterium]
TFSNPDSALKPGMFANAFLKQPGQIAAVFAPRDAVVRDKTTDANQVFVIEAGHARLRVVQSAEEADGMLRILSGIKAGETVATSGQTGLFEGVAVTAK